MKFNLEDILSCYQEKIGLYDKQSWETTVEQRILRGLSYSPRKTAKLKTNFIDVDLVRGSTFPKAKPQSDVWLSGLQGFIKMILCPIYFHWWIKETTIPGFIAILLTYCSVLTSFIIFFNFHHDGKILQNIPGFEVFLPGFLLILLSVIYSQMICTRRKGFKVPLNFKSKIQRPYYDIKSNARTTRQGRRNSSKSPSKKANFSLDFLDKIKTSKDSKLTTLDQSKPFDVASRSHSEDLRSFKHLLKENRSASETDINLHVLDNSSAHSDKSSKEEKDFNVDDEPVSQVRFRGGDRTKKASIEELHSTYRASEQLRSCVEKEPVNRVTPRPKVTTPQVLDQTSDMGSDEGEESCESPLSADENVYFGSKTKFRSCLSSKQKSSCGGPRSLPKLPSVRVDPSNSSCDSDTQIKTPLNHNYKQKHYVSSWIGITTNSEDPSYSSESDVGWDDLDNTNQSINSEPIDWHIQGAPAAVISSTKQVTDKVSCKIWEGPDMKKVDLSVLDISSAVISRVDALRHSSNYLKFGLVMSVVLSLVPSLYRELMTEAPSSCGNGTQSESNLHPVVVTLLGNNKWATLLICLSFLNRLVLGAAIFFLLSVAERTFKQRFLYAKHFCYLTSARRARKYDLPHFRLNKVINIKSWLSIRSCLKKRGPQHSIDVIVSATFITTLILVFYLGVEAIKDEEDRATQPLHNCELFLWCFAVGIYLVRFMTLGALINKKYSNPSVLITEQINMYLHMEQNPQKKDKLMLANNVLKLVSVLLKELDSPFKISGLSANTLLYNITKFGILSACSGVLSNLLGFKLKLHNIKFK